MLKGGNTFHVPRYLGSVAAYECLDLLHSRRFN